MPTSQGPWEPHRKNVDDTSPPENLDAWNLDPGFPFRIPFFPFLRDQVSGL